MCDCHKFQNQVCDVCQEIDPKNPQMDKLTDEEVVTKCIERVQKNGWNDHHKFEVTRDEHGRIIILGDKRFQIKIFSLEQIIFSIPFAKALWGKEPKYCSSCERVDPNPHQCDCDNYATEESWEFHIQQHVLSEDRIDYLRTYLLTNPE